MNIQTAIELIRAGAKVGDAVLIEGVHGIGKSMATQTVARVDGYHLEELFLSHQEVGDVIGVPHSVVIDGETVMKWSVPVWLYRMREAAKQGKKCLLFLDELNRAPLDVRQAALQLVLEGKIHEHALPIVDGQKTMIVAAINPAGDYQVDELDDALLDRFLHCAVEPDTKSWLSWARENNVNQIVRDFIAEYPDRLNWKAADGGVGASPRSWTKLAMHMNRVHEIAPEILFQIMKGKIGTEVASQFHMFYTNYVDVVKVADIIELVEENKDVTDMDELGAIIKEKIHKTEAIQKMELANQLADNYKDKEDILPFLAYLYALEIEILVSFLKSYRANNKEGYSKLAKVDEKLNGKVLFKRIVVAAEKA